jgi:hypothetical protein
MVVNLRSAVGVGMIWLAAVAGVSVTAWVAIDRAGRDITDGLVNSLSPSPVSTALVTIAPGVGAATLEAPPGPSAHPETSKAPEPSPVWTSSAAQKPSASPTSAAVVAPPARDSTFSARGGQVSVRCTGNAIQLRIAQPDNGWRVQVGSAGPDEVHVTFWDGSEEKGGGTQVTAVCAAGTPAFRVSSDN